MRDAPSRILITDLLTAGATVRAFDPAAGSGAKALYEKEHDVVIVGSATEALQGADALAIAADWPEFRQVAPETIRAALGEPLVVDGRNLFDPAIMQASGITYCGVGRGEA
jgi:UDPglucose 6-dehydrogenase